MDESLEVIFVEQGLYDVGFEINNRQFYEARFGMSTYIGGFQICFNKRHSFVYKAKTYLKCLSIRRGKFKHILSKFPEFDWQIRQKFLNHYMRHIYQPLTKKKNRYIEEFKCRNDFQ